MFMEFTNIQLLRQRKQPETRPHKGYQIRYKSKLRQDTTRMVRDTMLQPSAQAEAAE